MATSWNNVSMSGSTKLHLKRYVNSGHYLKIYRNTPEVIDRMDCTLHNLGVIGAFRDDAEIAQHLGEDVSKCFGISLADLSEAGSESCKVVGLVSGICRAVALQRSGLGGHGRWSKSGSSVEESIHVSDVGLPCVHVELNLLCGTGR